MRNFYTDDPNLATLLKAHLEPEFFQWAEEELVEYGALCANEIDDRARHTDREGQPKLVKYDKMGNDISFVWQNEGYLNTVKETYDRGIVGYVHKEIPALGHKGNYIYSFAQGYLLSHAEPGFYCPVTLTMATAYLIDHYADEKLREKFLPHVLATGDVELYEGATFLTERQGGSDVGANETRAVKEGEHYRLTGEKYFASNAGACGVAMVLARIDDQKQGTKGLSLFLVPWKKGDGSNNNLSIRRLKDKLGVKAVPSAEVLLEGSKAYLVGEASKGFSYMAEALNLSRLCNAVASVGIMQRAYLEAKNYAYEREAFKQKLKDFPMIRESLVNMKVKHEVEMSALFSSIALFEKVTSGQSSEEEQALNRLLIALVKKETAEQAVHFSHDAIEMHGGNGYIEDFVTPRLLRDAQVLTVWEGTANILGLEVLRLIHKYEVHHLFFARMKRELDDLPENLALEKTKILKAIESAHARINQISQMDQSMQTYHSKRMTKWLTDIFESTIALKDAAQFGERKQAIASIFIERTLQNDHYLLSDLTLKHYELIVEKTAVSSKLQTN